MVINSVESKEHESNKKSRTTRLLSLKHFIMRTLKYITDMYTWFNFLTCWEGNPQLLLDIEFFCLIHVYIDVYQ